MTPTAALRLLEAYVADNPAEKLDNPPEVSEAFDTLWLLVLTGKRNDS
ncbi:MAG TPA: hypothetical protein VGG75_38675 [Trebonia sp.]|jgi:hypothetical protein